jgi:probable F420-dependent oxidoreductase
MKLGFGLPVAGAWATPENMARIAREAEALGYHSVWTVFRLLYPAAPRDDYPYAAPGPWPEPFKRVLDSIVALAYVAAVTSRVRLGTAVLNLPYYQPVMLAKQLATLDVVSGGRLVLGAGLGWSRDEYEAVGVPFHRRGRRMDECLRCLNAAWTEEVVRFDGEFYSVPPSLVEPKPVQRPRPPIVVGGYAEATIRRAVTLADGWIGGNVPLERVAPLVRQLSEAAEEAGRDPSTLHVVSRGSVRLEEFPQGEDRRPLFGSLDEVREDVERYGEAGLTELFLELNFDPRIASPDADPGAGLERALELMHALAPPAESGSRSR